MFDNSAAVWSFCLMIGSIVGSIAAVVYMYFCYFPGGYRRDQVMDIGEYAMFVAQARTEERKKRIEKEEEEDYEKNYDELYHDGDFAAKKRWEDGDEDPEDSSDQYTDLESGEEPERGHSPPSSRTLSETGRTFDGQSVVSASSGGGTMPRQPLKSALKTPKDESESTYTSSTPSSSGGSFRQPS